MRFTVNGKLNPGEFWSQSKVHRSRAFCPGRCLFPAFVAAPTFSPRSWPSLNAKISIILSFNFVSRRETCSSSSAGTNYTEQTIQIELNCLLFYLLKNIYIYNWINYYLLKVWKLRTIFRIAINDTEKHLFLIFIDFWTEDNNRIINYYFSFQFFDLYLNDSKFFYFPILYKRFYSCTL